MKLIDVVEHFLENWEEKAKKVKDPTGKKVNFSQGDFYEIFLKLFENNLEESSLMHVSENINYLYDKFKKEGILSPEGFPKISISYLYKLINKGHFDREIFLSWALPEQIPTSGHISPSLIIEPVNEGHYAYSYKNSEETKAKITQILASDITEYNKKKKKTINSIYIDGEEIKISPFDVTEIGVITGYRFRTLNRLMENPPKVKTLWKEIKGFLKNYVDMQEHDYDIATLFIIQSWVFPVLQSVFYLQVKAPFGGGKTTLGTAVSSLCRHGYTVANASPASVARGIEARQSTVFFDEIDQGQKLDDDSSLWNVLRIGQKKTGGSDIYERVGPNGEIQRFRVFGPKIFAVHSQVEEALSQRSIPLILYPTDVGDLAIKNLFRDSEAITIKTKLLAWFLNDGLKVLSKLYDARINAVDGEYFFSNLISKKAFEKVTSIYKSMGLSPRNVELFLIMSLILEAIDIDIYDSVKHVLKVKMQEDEEFRDMGLQDIVRESIIDWYEKIKDNYASMFTNTDSFICVPYDGVFKSINRKLRSIGLPSITARKLRGVLRELSIDKPDVFKKVSLPKMVWDRENGEQATQKRTTRRAFVFTPALCRVLGVEFKKGVGELEQYIG